MLVPRIISLENFTQIRYELFQQLTVTATESNRDKDDFVIYPLQCLRMKRANTVNSTAASPQVTRDSLTEIFLLCDDHLVAGLLQTALFVQGNRRSG